MQYFGLLTRSRLVANTWRRTNSMVTRLSSIRVSLERGPSLVVGTAWGGVALRSLDEPLVGRAMDRIGRGRLRLARRRVYILKLELVLYAEEDDPK